MIALALDTSSKPGSVALVRDGVVVECLVGEASRTHGERLPGEVARLLTRHGLSAADVDVYGVAAGPGSFTGLRVGIATIQALALVTGRPVVGISSLVALAASAPDEGELVASWIDAQRGEVFAALYARAPDGGGGATDDPEAPPPGFRVLQPSSVGSPEATLEAWASFLPGRHVVFIGDGAVLYQSVLNACLSGTVRVLSPPPLAPVVGRLALERARRGGGQSPHALRPVYVRRPDAELARDGRQPQQPTT